MTLQMQYNSYQEWVNAGNSIPPGLEFLKDSAIAYYTGNPQDITNDSNLILQKKVMKPNDKSDPIIFKNKQIILNQIEQVDKNSSDFYIVRYALINENSEYIKFANSQITFVRDLHLSYDEATKQALGDTRLLNLLDQLQTNTLFVDKNQQAVSIKNLHTHYPNSCVISNYQSGKTFDYAQLNTDSDSKNVFYVDTDTNKLDIVNAFTNVENHKPYEYVFVNNVNDFTTTIANTLIKNNMVDNNTIMVMFNQ